MKRRRTAQCGFFNLRFLITVLACAAAACSMVSGALLAFFRPEAPAKISQRTLTFQERVAYQRAIEDVYWRHRIWPKENPDPKPTLDAVISRAQIEKKVAEYLRESQMLEDHWQRPITAERLQTEMNRMAKHTKQPEVLRELFEALGNDPSVIAECLARPTLAERLVTNFYTNDRDQLDPSRAKAGNQMPKPVAAASASYELPTISDVPNGCADDTWTATSTVGAPSDRYSHTAVWTGSEMIVWGGYNGSHLNTGARYNPSTDSWTVTSITNAPAGRSLHTAIWTGSEMIVWGGVAFLNTGGKYNPATNTWTATSTTNAPTGRYLHTAVWTGNQMIVWGGLYCDSTCHALNTGGRYNPSTDSWTATNSTNVPSAREVHTAVWTGSEMIVWGGVQEGIGYLNTGGRYDPGTDNWTATSTTNAPTARWEHTAVWVGSQMIVWGGSISGPSYLNTGGRYNPSTDSWTATSTTNAPAARGGHSAVWTGREMILWGGFVSNANYLNSDRTYRAEFPPLIPNPTPTATPTATATASPTPSVGTGARYDPDTDGWRATSTTNSPNGRSLHTAVWTGSEMIVWGGAAPFATNTGGRYCAQFVAPSPTPTATPTATATHTPTATPSPTARPSPLPRVRPTPAPRP